jgi:flagellar hook assembly protein FlgD
MRSYSYPEWEEGILSITWDGKDAEGNDQPAGYYILEAYVKDYYQSTFIQRN